MLPENFIKEKISIAYVNAISTIKSFSMEIISADFDSVDVSIRGKRKLVEESIWESPIIDLQLKATSKPKIIKENIHFDLPVKNYNDLIGNTATPRLLIVLVLPESKEEWVEHTLEYLMIKKCAYYLNLFGMPPTKNDAKVTVHIPLKNIFSPETLYNLMVKVSIDNKI